MQILDFFLPQSWATLTFQSYYTILQYMWELVQAMQSAFLLYLSLHALSTLRTEKEKDKKIFYT